MKTYAITFTLGLLLGLFFSFMYRTLLIDLPGPPVSKAFVVAAKKNVLKAEQHFSNQFDSLKAHSTKLNDALTKTQVKLAESKKLNRQLTKDVHRLIDRQMTSSIVDADTPICDSLAASVEILIDAGARKDSLYEDVTANLSEQIEIKDSSINLMAAHQQMLRTNLDHSLSNQLLLLDERSLLQKQVRRQKIKSKFLSGALLIVTGAAIHRFIRR